MRHATPDDVFDRLLCFLADADNDLELADACLSATFLELGMAASDLIIAREMLASTQGELRRLRAWVARTQQGGSDA